MNQIKNRFFDELSLATIANPNRWSIISPFYTTVSKTVLRDNFIRQWAYRHHHNHPFYEALVAVRGSTFIGLKNAIFPCRPRTLILIPSHLSHSCKYYPSDDQLYHIWISFISPAQAFVQFVIVEKGRVRRLGNERSLFVINDLSRLLNSLQILKEGDMPTKAIQIRLLLHAFLAELLNGLLELGYHSSSVIDHEFIRRKKI